MAFDDNKHGFIESKARDVVAKTEQTVQTALTVLWNDLPIWLQDNQYIQSGYRPVSNSFRKSATSVFQLHNESVNIWTHLIGAIIAGIAGFIAYSSIKTRYTLATHDDVLVLACYFLGAITCLGMSGTFHAISNHSEAVAKFGNRLDYVGIIFLIWGSFVPSIYYGFSSEPRLIRIYWSMMTTIGAGTFFVVLSPKFRTPEWRLFRAAMFVAMAMSAVIPILHGVQKYGLAQLEKQVGLSYIVAQGVLYIAGAVIYAARVPERWKPGYFDLFGSSHQIFHVLVLAAASMHLAGLCKAFDYEHSYRVGLMSAYSSARKLGGQ